MPDRPPVVDLFLAPGLEPAEDCPTCGLALVRTDEPPFPTDPCPFGYGGYTWLSCFACGYYVRVHPTTSITFWPNPAGPHA